MNPCFFGGNRIHERSLLSGVAQRVSKPPSTDREAALPIRLLYYPGSWGKRGSPAVRLV